MKKLHTGMRSLLLTVIMMLIMFVNADVTVKAENAYVWEINSMEQFIDLVQWSKTQPSVGYRIILNTDLVIDDQVKDDLKTGKYDTADVKIRSLTIGCSNNKFSGIFDGQGHTVFGLTYDSGEAGYLADNGLFSYTDGAVIRNLTIADASIDSDYRGGFVAGSADNTLFENIIVKDSYMRVSCSNNVVTLVTDGGLSGGAIAGEANHCVLYNCESNNTVINNNNTAGVAALGGKGLYLGGLVGSAVNGTEIEYSRVVGGEVKSHYDVAVGALGGNTLYVGGVVGQMKSGSKVTDCFATPKLYYYAATYVSVGAGNSGHIGGICAAVYGETCVIERCHFAGEMSSKQYNAVLVIPIIQKNVNLSGIVDKVADKVSVYDSYFKVSKTGDVDTVGNDTVTGEYGPQNDERYMDIPFWKSHGYDFVGNVERSTKYYEDYGTVHANKWVMDYEQQIPVHGKNVAATLDFSGAGTVTISATDLVSSTVSTSNPYKFAVQGITFRETKVNTLIAEAEAGYKFDGWYKVSDMPATSMAEDHGYFDSIFMSGSPIVDAEARYSDVPCEDNDLFIARYQAKVLFHDINGNVLGVDGAVDENEEDDWYYYEAKLPAVEPKNRPEGSGARLIGWTTVKSSEAGGGYSAITSLDLAELNRNGTFYETGDPVTKTLSLYPVYTDLISKVYTVLEGHEQDALDDPTQRNGVGTTSVTVGDDGYPVIQVVLDNTDGYRFLGWYDEVGNLISTSEIQSLVGVDLTEKDSYTYTARLEYRVDYYSETKGDVAELDGIPYASIWHKYQEIFQYIKDVGMDAEDAFSHWAWSVKEEACDSCSDEVDMNYEVVSPIKVYAHVTGNSGHDILITTDFPNSGVLTNGGDPGSGNSFWVQIEKYDGYNFLFWAAENKRTIGTSDWQETCTDTYYLAEGSGYRADWIYRFEAHLNADVTYYKSDQSTALETSTRIYGEKVILKEGTDFAAGEGGVTHTYTYPISGDGIPDKTDFSEATPTAEAQENCCFIGWINGTDIKENGDGTNTEQWAYIYDVSANQSLTSEISKVAPYLVTADDLVTKPMELYPVYMKYQVETTTNIAEQGVISDMINIPTDPVVTGIDTSNPTSTITVAANTDTYITGDSGEKYKLISVTVRKDGEEIETLIPDENGAVSYRLEAGPTYTFVANYEPLVVIYHTATDAIEVVVRNKGEVLGKAPEEAGVSGLVLVGWAENKPESGWYHTSAEGITLVNENTMVTKSLELWPVYLPVTLKVDSNIDTMRTDHRGLVAPLIGEPWMMQSAWSVQAIEVNTYEFQGWYKYWDENDGMEPVLLTEQYIYVLEEDELLSNAIYTAVYYPIDVAYTINYYSTDGTVLHSVGLTKEEGARTFVENIPTEDGEGSMEVPVDAEAFTAIETVLNTNQQFQTWYYNHNGTAEIWDAFKYISVTDIISKQGSSVLNIYPVVREALTLNSTGNIMDYGDESREVSVKWSIDQKEENGDVVEKVKVITTLNQDYSESKLTVAVTDKYYTVDGAVQKNIPVQQTAVLLNLTSGMGGGVMTEETDNYGNAVFKFIGLLKIKKIVTNGDGTGVFLFTVTNANEKSQSVKVVVKESTETEDNTVILEVPYGTYTVTEDNAWAWRYEEQPAKNVTISGATTNLEAECSFINVLTNSKWFAEEDNTANEFIEN